MAEDTIKCPKCGFENPGSSEDCESCGITIDIYRAEKERAKILQTQNDEKERAEDEKQKDDLSSCPNCGHPTDLSSEDCLKCGIVFSKEDKEGLTITIDEGD